MLWKTWRKKPGKMQPQQYPHSGNYGEKAIAKEAVQKATMVLSMALSTVSCRWHWTPWNIKKRVTDWTWEQIIAQFSCIFWFFVIEVYGDGVKEYSEVASCCCKNQEFTVKFEISIRWHFVSIFWLRKILRDYVIVITIYS